MGMMKEILLRPYKSLLEALYPNNCIVCNEIIEESEYLCEQCYNSIENLDKSKLCIRCGQEKQDCLCSYKAFHFVGIVSAFANNGPAKTAYYSYKLSRKMQYADFFAERLALTIKNNYRNIDFDFMCAVPSSLSSRAHRGFAHCQLICDKCAKLLNIKVLNDVIMSKSFIKSQHKSSPQERITNVRGKYYYRSRLSGGKILLIDDIFTTGATLDECALQLLRAGADEVYCATLLITQPKKLKK